MSTSTIESKTNFMRDGAATSYTRPLHRGRSTVVIETELRDATDRLVAKVTQTQSDLYPREPSAPSVQ